MGATRSERLPVKQNLETVFGIELPSPATSKREDFADECAICYAYRFNGSIPDRACENLHCAKPFHRECLFEWLRSLPTARQAFDSVFGQCPYCSEPISCKMAARG